MALRTLSLNPVIVRIGVAGHAVVVRHIAELLEILAVLFYDLMAFFTIYIGMLAR